MKVFLFAETPRATSDHPAIVSTRNAADFTVRNKYIPLARDGKTGKDYISVCQAAPRTRLGKTDRSTETLVLAAPGYDLSELRNRQQIERKLEDYLKQIADIHDWTDETRQIVALERFNEWQDELAVMISNCSPLRRNNKLRLLGIFFIVLIIAGFALTQCVGQSAIDLLKRIWIQTSDNTNLKLWLNDLGVESSSTDENELKQKLWETLSQAFETKVPLDDLEKNLLPNFAMCLQYEKNKKIDLLDDKEFRSKVAGLFIKSGENAGKLNPFGAVQEVMGDNDKSTHTPWFFIYKDNEKIEPELKLNENREFFRKAHSVMDAAKKVERKDVQGLLWVKFAGKLNFTRHDKDQYLEWEKIDEMKPLFVTDFDISVAKIIYEWLKGADADAVLKGSKPSNYQEAVKRFGDWSSADSIDGGEKLKLALNELRDAAKPLFPTERGEE